MAGFFLKILGMMCATVIAYKLATEKDGKLENTHPYAALFLELVALAIIF